MAIDFPNSPSTGQDFTVGTTTWTYDGAKWNLKTASTLANDAMPVGSIMWYAGSTAPAGWVACNGASYPISTYPNLYQVIGNTFGGTSPNFNVPTISATTGTYYVRYTTAVGVQTTFSLMTAPVGSMLNWPTTSSFPTGWLRCDGSSYSTVTYNDLFTLIGYTYGGSGTSFSVPNMLTAGAGSPVTIIKATASGFVEPSTVSHSATHTEGGSDAVSVTLNQVPNYQSSRNRIINGNFAVWQRGNTRTLLDGSKKFLADRWCNSYYQSAAAERVTLSAGGPNSSQYALRVSSTTTGEVAAGTRMWIAQKIESVDAIPYRSKPITVSFWLRCASTSVSSFGRFNYDLGFSTTTTDADPYTNTADILSAGYIANGSFPTSWTKYTITATAPSNTNNIEVRFHMDNLASTVTSSLFWYEIAEVQLEVGSVATPFEFEPYETTLKKCQRYYQTLDQWRWQGAVHGASGLRWAVPIKTTMRIAPNVTLPTPAISGLTGQAADNIGVDIFHISASATAAVLNAYLIFGAITLSAEL